MNKKVFISIVVTFAIIIFVLMFFFISNHEADIVPIESRAIPTSTNQTTTPTIIPPELKTQWAYYRQTQQVLEFLSSATLQAAKTQQAANYLPTHDFQKIYPGSYDLIPEDARLQQLSGTLAGYGILQEDDPPMIVETIDGKKRSPYDLNYVYWYEERFDSFISVWTGVSNIHPGKGIVYVITMPHYDSYQNITVVEHPYATGSLTIIDAEEEHLILQSTDSGILYFDVPSMTFLNSLIAQIPTATQVPTNTPQPAPQNQSTDDVADYPIDVFEYSSTGTDLRYFINFPNDYDWYLFYTLVPGDISISLSNTPGVCALRLVKLGTTQGGDNGKIIGEDVTGGSDNKLLTILDAQPSDYMVRVWCPDGSYSIENPYTLRIDVPTPKPVIPILDCVYEINGGNYIARFSYNNPNQDIVVVGADESNTFSPYPNFRTGQPELFAPGKVKDFFSVLFDGNDLTWTLDGTSITANRDSHRCP